MLEKRRALGTLRKLLPTSPLIDFASNDYLGAARSATLFQSVFAEIQSTCGIYKQLGSTGSRLLTGNHPFAEELEESIARFHKASCGLLFNSGFAANLGIARALVSEGKTAIFDSELHASTREGLSLCKGRRLPFFHNDLNHLEKRLKRAPKSFVFIESIYSTSGDFAPLHEIAMLCRHYGAKLIVDEAHTTGLFGPSGSGLVCEKGLQDFVFARIYTFGKALGVQGAIAVGGDLLKQLLINFASSFIYTTAPSLLHLAAIKSAYKWVAAAYVQRERVKRLAMQFDGKKGPIKTLPLSMAKTLKTNGFHVSPLLSPTVRRGRERVRICLHAYNTKEQVTQLLKILEK